MTPNSTNALIERMQKMSPPYDHHASMGPKNSSTSRGYSLVELMITIAILGIVVAFALPSYKDYVYKSRRGDAMLALTDLANVMERSMFANNSYRGNIITSGDYSSSSRDQYYQLAVAVSGCNANATGCTAYTLTATANSNASLGPTDQTKDTNCQVFTLTSTGNKTSSPSTSDCWR